MLSFKYRNTYIEPPTPITHAAKIVHFAVVKINDTLQPEKKYEKQ